MSNLKISRRALMKIGIAGGAALAAIPLAPNAQAQTSPTSTSAMATAANDFLATLNSALRDKATYDFGDRERTNWHWVPRARNGVSIGEMSAAQRDAALKLLRAGTTQAGYTKALNIASLQAELGRDPNAYFFTVFGAPAANGTWGWRFEGHHLAMNYTLAGGKVSISPLFLGAWPTEIEAGRPQAGLRTLKDEEDIPRQLLQSLNAQQRRAALVSERPFGDVTTRNAVQVEPLAPVGLPAGDMTDAQRRLITGIVTAYLDTTVAGRDLLARVNSAGIENIRFAWAGSPDKGQRYSYRLQGPTFLLEHDNTRNAGTHIHSAWRDFENDFGRDIV
jgi:hypothetical protein